MWSEYTERARFGAVLMLNVKVSRPSLTLFLSVCVHVSLVCVCVCVFLSCEKCRHNRFSKSPNWVATTKTTQQWVGGGGRRKSKRKKSRSRARTNVNAALQSTGAASQRSSSSDALLRVVFIARDAETLLSLAALSAAYTHVHFLTHTHRHAYTCVVRRVQKFP